MSTTYTTDYITNHTVGLAHITNFTTNLFVHKSHTGMGGTTAFLQCDKNVLIISPNTGMVQKKAETNANDAIYIYHKANGKWTEAITKAKSGEIVKVNSTWKSLQTLASNKGLFDDVCELFHLVIDEQHCLYDGLDDDSISLTDIIPQFKKPWVSTTATPMKFDSTIVRADTVYFESTKPKEKLTILVAENDDTDLSDIIIMQMHQTGLMIASNNNKYTALYPSRHQVLASDKFKVRSNANNAFQINDKISVDDSCDYVQYTTRYNTGFDIFGKWHSAVVAEHDDKYNVDAKTHQQVRQAMGRLRDTSLSNTILWRSTGDFRSLKEIENDIQKNPNNTTLIREYAVTETYADINYFKTIMEGYGYEVSIEYVTNFNSIRRMPLLQAVNHIIENKKVELMTANAFKYIGGDNRDKIGLPPTTIIAHIIAKLITDGVISIEKVQLVGEQPRRIYSFICGIIKDKPQYEMYHDFIAIHTFNNKVSSIVSPSCPIEFAEEKRRIEIYTKAYGQANKNLVKHSNGFDSTDIAKAHFRPMDILKNVAEVAERVCDGEADVKICKKLVNRITTKVQSTINGKGTIADLRLTLNYNPKQIIKRWMADNMFLFCKKYDLPANHFVVNRTGNREYNPLTKAETWTRYKLPIDTCEYDIKEAYPSFIDKILSIETGKGIYDRIASVKNIERPEAKIYYNKLINNHYLQIDKIKEELSSIGYDNKAVEWLAPRISKNEMHIILTEFEADVIGEFASVFGANFARLHDAIVTFVPADIRIKKHFEDKGIIFGGEFIENGQTTILTTEERIMKAKEIANQLSILNRR